MIFTGLKASSYYNHCGKLERVKLDEFLDNCRRKDNET